MNQYELRDRQESSAQHHVRWIKAFYASLVIGVIFLILPRAVPWFSSGVPETAMGRPIVSVTEFKLEPFLMTAGLHLLLAISYGCILAMLIYRLEIKKAVFIGGFAGLTLYVINFVLFRVILGMMIANEAAVLFTHLFFSLIFSAAYKGISVPDAARFSDLDQWP